jgi:hypothetical protein
VPMLMIFDLTSELSGWMAQVRGIVVMVMGWSESLRVSGKG